MKKLVIGILVFCWLAIVFAVTYGSSVRPDGSFYSRGIAGGIGLGLGPLILVWCFRNYKKKI